LVDGPLQDWLDAAPTSHRRRLLVGLTQAATATDFVTATKAATRLLTFGVTLPLPPLGCWHDGWLKAASLPVKWSTWASMTS
jgi:hypothetical protein